MAAITTTVRAGGPYTVNRTTASASDTFTYTANTSQSLELHNNTAGALTAVIKGTAPSAAYSVPGVAGLTTDLSAGLSVVLAAGQTKNIHLDSIAPYLAGTGVVTVSGASGLTVILLSN